jgi:aspartate ammonia-lyase
LTGLGLARAENMIEATQNADVFVEASGLLKTAAVNLAKIAADLRLLSSGPRAGLGEIRLPELQAGSSIMPGKVNPVATEAVTQIAYQVIANDAAITLAAQAGQLELNAFLPLIAHNLLQQLDLIHGAVALLTERCVKGISANADLCRRHVEDSYGLLTAVAPYIGYDEASEVAREAAQTGDSIKDLLLERGLFDEDDLGIIMAPEEMTKPGIPGWKRMRVGASPRREREAASREPDAEPDPGREPPPHCALRAAQRRQIEPHQRAYEPGRGHRLERRRYDDRPSSQGDGDSAHRSGRRHRYGRHR